MLSKTQWLIIGGISIVVVGVITFMLLKTKNNLNVSKPKLKNKNPKEMNKLFEKAAVSGSETEEVKHSRRELESKVKSLEYELEF
jgi:hypothetical protein